MGVKNQLKGIGTLQETTDKGSQTTNSITVYSLEDSQTTSISKEGIDFINPLGDTGVSLRAELQTGNVGTLLIPNVGLNPQTIATREWITKGLVQKTTTEINAIASPTEGEQYYNTTLHTICFYNGTTWQKVTSTNM